MRDTAKILAILDEAYPFDGVCFLHFKTPWQLLFATILSAQCTDDRVNKTTAPLFAAHPDLPYYAEADIAELENHVRPTGFFRMKAKHIKATAQILLSEHGGELPREMGKLTALPGVGRKTANVVRSHIFKQPAVVVDTHVMRVSRRLGLAQGKDPVKIEYELMETLPESHWIRFNQQVISHGRSVCTARSPKCGACVLKGECAACSTK
jgi:endonuclease-3